MAEGRPLRFSRDYVPANLGFKGYRKKTVTKIARIDGPFEVETREGSVYCPDGYLAIDSKGYPYPVAADEFEAIYEPENQNEDSSMNQQEILLRKQAAALELEAYAKLEEAMKAREACGNCDAAMMAGGPSVGPATIVSPEATLPEQHVQPVVTLVMASTEKRASLEILNKVASELFNSGDAEMKKLAQEVDNIAESLDKCAFVYESDTKDPELEMHTCFKGGVDDHDKDEPYMSEFKTDVSHEVAQAIKDKRVYAPIK